MLRFFYVKFSPFRMSLRAERGNLRPSKRNGTGTVPYMVNRAISNGGGNP